MTDQPFEVANCLTQRMHKGINTTVDEGQTPVLAFHGSQDPDPSGDVTHPLGRNQGREACVAIAENQRGELRTSDVQPALAAPGGKPGQGNPVVFESRFVRNGRGAPEEVCPPLKAQSGTTGRGDASPMVLTGLTVHGTDGTTSVVSETEVASALRARTPGMIENSTTTVVQTRLSVRRLTPRECERLQGFPDDWTVVPYRGKETPADGPRYKALGNSMAVNVMHWIGMRISPAWVPCPDCDDYLCLVHAEHAYDCECPPVEDWLPLSPYEPGATTA